MRVAALDLGTNTFLCLIAEVDKGQVRQVIADDIWLVRLGQDVQRTKRFHPQALERARAALTQARDKIKKFQVEKCLAVATSAARDVSNASELVAICRELDIPLEIISGPREAELTFGGATQDIGDSQGIVVIDVGGGSTEMILKARRDLKFQSVDVGSVRITEKFFTGYPISAIELEQARGYIRNELRAIQFAGPEIRQVIAVAGTPTTLTAIDLGIAFDAAQVDGKNLRLERLDHWLTIFVKMTPQAIMSQFQIEAKRADVIAAGTLILRECLSHLNRDSMQVSTRGVRYGVASYLEMLEAK